MPFIPHTDEDIQAMLEAIGVESIDELFDEIPETLRANRFEQIPKGQSEMALSQEMEKLSERDHIKLNFLGAGAYEHHIPAAVWDITSRGEWMTTYTPYQAEASQGSLQLIYEFQTMIANLTGMEVANASLYDGATALAEAVLMAIRAGRGKSKRILIPRNCHPRYREVIQSVVCHQKIELVEIPFDPETGLTDFDALKAHDPDSFAALVISNPNFFGGIESIDELTDWAHQQNALVIAVVNPISLGLLKEPGAWGQAGADIVCGEGQPLGIPLASGGPYFGFMSCRSALVRQMPGRIVGRTHDDSVHTGFTLTLQAREQHIRRSKATSNICTNQGLAVTAATIFMSLLGYDGIRQVAKASHAKTKLLRDTLIQSDRFSIAFNSPFFHESVIKVDGSAGDLLDRLASKRILGGYLLKDDYPELGDAILVCATETKTEQDIYALVKEMTK